HHRPAATGSGRGLGRWDAPRSRRSTAPHRGAGRGRSGPAAAAAPRAAASAEARTRGGRPVSSPLPGGRSRTGPVGQRYSSNALMSADFDFAPWNAFTSSPLSYTCSVGRPITWWVAGVTGLVLVSIFTKVILSPYSLASSSMIGEICLHGEHQSAQ